MTITSTTRAAHRAELDTLDAVVTLLDADRRRDPVAYRSLLHDELVEHVDGVLSAIGPEAGLASAQARWAELGDRHIEIDDVDVTHPMAYVRFAVHAPHAEDDAPTVVAVGYSVYELGRGKVRAANHFLRPIVVPPPAPAPAVTVGRAEHPPAEPAPPPAAARWHRFAMPVVGIASWLAQDALLAAPVVAVTARYGMLRAFTVMATLYFVASVLATGITLRLLARREAGAKSRLGEMLDRVASHGAGLGALRAGGAFGFVVGSYFMSAAPTVWAMHELGVRRHLRLLGVIASAIWACGFVAFYAGAATLIGL